ncbi:hypothetical protein Syun_018836 [Stephania yunnanensis]|uniref:Uncharacterized protein n=1 Tax=Stephania yunnanensis TaxID=152371 RepID=A0AAP0IT50_9MAGN
MKSPIYSYKAFAICPLHHLLLHLPHSQSLSSTCITLTQTPFITVHFFIIFLCSYTSSSIPLKPHLHPLQPITPPMAISIVFFLFLWDK